MRNFFNSREIMPLQQDNDPFVIRIQSPKCWLPLGQLSSLESFTSFCNIPLQFRLIDRNDKDVQWEDEAPNVQLTPGEFREWLQGSISSEGKKSIATAFNKDDFALYAAYQYVHEAFSDCPSILNLMEWADLGLSGRGPEHTTLWLGSAGSYTPGHYDTYGCNFVAQLFGKKRWILFPPSQTDLLYPTRQPYEESSVFSQCSLRLTEKYPKFKKTTPYVVDLTAGDLLCVPPRWWHFVSCLETSLTINTWFDLPEIDDFSRVEEALVKWIISSQDSNIRINYTEKDFPSRSDCDKLLKLAIDQMKSKAASSQTYNPVDQVLEAARKNSWPKIPVEPIKYSDFVTFYCSSEDSEAGENIKEERNDILDALLSPDVIKLAAQKLV